MPVLEFAALAAVRHRALARADSGASRRHVGRCGGCGPANRRAVDTPTAMRLVAPAVIVAGRGAPGSYGRHSQIAGLVALCPPKPDEEPR
jgi:hypothetical protein